MHKKINKKIEKLWANFPRERGTRLAPLFYNEFKCSGLLFVGCNPSFPEKPLKKWIRDAINEKYNPREFYNWEKLRNRENAIEELLKIELKARGSETTCKDENTKSKQRSYQYFSPLMEIIKGTGFEDRWEHVDVFLVRCTNQRKFKNQIEKKEKLTKFGKTQFKIFESVLSAVKPQIMVISSAYISGLLQRAECFGNKLEWNDKHGWYNLNLGVSNPIPVFLSSMLSGQRALDIESRKRLIWHIKEARKHLYSEGGQK